MPDQEADEHVISDPELITRVRAGDREAFGELYKRHAGPATTLARQFARSAAESDDLVSESFARVLDNLLAGKGPDAAFRAYLFTTVRNTAYDRTRKDKKLQFTDDMETHDVAVAGDDPVLAKMESGLVATAFAQLPERWQAVLWHTQVEGESPAQVGALLGMAPGAVSSLAFRAREGLREAYLQAHLAETAAEKCRSTVERLGAWTRGGLSKREKAQVDAHLEECDRCRALAAELAEVNSGLRGLLAPLLLGGAAAGYLATLGPVAPLAAPGTLLASVNGGAAAGGASSGIAAGGTSSGGGASGGAGGAGGASGGAVGGASAAGGAAGTSAAATAAGIAAGVGVAGAAAFGVAAFAAGGEPAATAGAAAAGGNAAAGAAGGATGGGAAGGAAAGAAPATTGGGAAVGGAAGGSAAGGSSAGGSAAGGSSAGGSAAAGAAPPAAGGGAAGVGAAGGGAAAGGAAGAAGAGGAAGATGIAAAVASIGAGWLTAAAAVVVAAIVAVAVVVNNSSPETISADSMNPPGASIAQPVPGGSNDPGSGTDGGNGAGIGNGTDTGAGTGTGGNTGAATGTGGDTGGATGTGVDPGAGTGTGGDPGAGTGTGGDPGAGAGGTATGGTGTGTGGAGTGGTGTGTGDNGGTGTGTEDKGGTGTGSGDGTTTNPNNPSTSPAPTTAPTGTTAENPTTAPPTEPSEPTTEPTGPTTEPTGPTTEPTGPTTEPTGPTTEPTGPTTPPPTPASLSVSGTASASLIAGSNANQVTATIANTGGSPSAVTPVTIDVPAGVQVTGAATSEESPAGTALRRATAGLLRAGPLGDCVVDGTSCALQLPAISANSKVDLQLVVSVAPDATDGELVVRIGGVAVPLEIEVKALSGVGSLVGTAGGPGSFVQGTTTPLRLTVTPNAGVTDAGGINASFPADTGLRFRDLPENCSSTSNDESGSSGIDCTGTTITVDVWTPGDAALGALPITVTDAGGRVITQLLDGSAPNLQIVRPGTVSVSELTLVSGPIAGGTATVRADVQNTGDIAADEELIEFGQPDGAALPDGFYLSDITVGDESLCEQPTDVVVTGPSCTLPSLGKGESAQLTIVLGVSPVTPEIIQPSDLMTVRIGNSVAQVNLGPVQTGIEAITATGNSPLQAGQQNPLAVDVDLKAGVNSAGPVTFILTAPGFSFADLANCAPVGESADRPTQVVCNTQDPGFSVAVPYNAASGQYRISVTDAGGRDLTDLLEPLEVAAAPPATLLLSDPTITQPTAGGSGRVSLKISNGGGQPSGSDVPLEVALVDAAGIGIESIAVADGAVGPLTCSGAEQATCTLPEIQPGGFITVQVEISATPAAVAGSLQFRLGVLEPVTAELTVQAAITSVVATPGGPFYPDSRNQVTLTANTRSESADPGPIRFLSGSLNVRFADLPESCSPVTSDENGSSEISCTETTVELTLTIAANQSAGDLPVTAVDAGNRSYQVTDATFQPIQVLVRPASLSVSNLTVTTQPIAGGTAVASFTVTNSGGQYSLDAPIVVTGPTGFSLISITGNQPVTCAGTGTTAVALGSCVLSPLQGGATANLVVTYGVPAATPETPDGGLGFGIAMGTSSQTNTFSAVQTGIGSLKANVEYVVAGSSNPLTISAALKASVTDGGAITFAGANDQVSFVAGENCSSANEGSSASVVCTGTQFALTINLPAGQGTSLPIVITDAGGRDLGALLDSQNNQMRVVQPANLVQSELQFQTPVAGGHGAFSMVVTNQGGVASEPTPVDVVLPDGMSLQTITIAGSTTCTISGGPPTNTLLAAASQCLLPTLQSNASTTLGFYFSVPADAAGTLTASVAIGGAPNVFGLPEVVSGLSPRLTADGEAELAAGQSTELSIHADVLDDVSDPGNITFTSTSAGVNFAGTDTCDVNGGATPSVSCDLTDSRTLTLAVVVAPDVAPGPLPITATDAGKRPLEVKNEDGNDPQIVAPAKLDIAKLATIATPVAGGTGAFGLTVTNNGGTASDPAGIDVVLPQGFTLADVTAGGQSLCNDAPTALAAGQVCTLPALGKARSTDITVTFAVAADTRSPGPTSPVVASITIGGKSASLDLDVLSGITGLKVLQSDDLVVGRSSELTVEATTAENLADPGPLTFNSGSTEVTLGCGDEKAALIVTCPIVDNSVQLTVHVGTLPDLSPLPVTVTDAGNRPLTLLNIPLVHGAPDLHIDNVQITEPLIAGGTGAFTATVTNNGGSASNGDDQIHVVLPDGLTVNNITVPDSNSCAPAPQLRATAVVAAPSCTVPILGVGESLLLGFYVEVEPTVTATVEDPAEGSIGIGEGDPFPIELPVVSGINSLTAGSAPLLAGQENTLDIAVTKAVADPGPVTFVSSDAGVSFVNTASCRTAGGSGAVECPLTGVDQFQLIMHIDSKQFSGDLPVTAHDAGGRDVPLRNAAGGVIQVNPAPAEVKLSNPVFTTVPVAGGSGTFTMTADNVGGSPTTKDLPITVGPLSGVALGSVTVDGVVCTSDGTRTCTLPEVPVGASKNLTFEITVAPGIKDGSYQLPVTIDGTTATATFAVKGSTFTGVAASPGGPFKPGASVQLTVSPKAADGAQTPGDITFTSTNTLVSFGAGACSVVGQTATCSGTGPSVLTVNIGASTPAGILPITATDAGGRIVPFLNELRIDGRPQLVVSEPTIKRPPNLGTDEFTLTVSNPGTAQSPTLPITIVLPNNYQLFWVTGSGRLLPICVLTTNCTLAPIAGGKSVTLDFVVVGLTSTDASATVTIDGTTRTAKLFGLPDGQPAGSTASSSTTNTATATSSSSTSSSVPTPTISTTSSMPKTVPSTSTSTEAETPAVGSTSSIPTAPDPATTSENPSGPPMDDADSSTETPAETTDQGPTSESVPSGDTMSTDADEPSPTDETTGQPIPAFLSAGGATALPDLKPGGSGTFSFAVTNTGGTDSARTTINLDATGVSVQSISVDGTAVCGAKNLADCVLHELKPGESAKVTVTIAAAKDSPGGGIDIRIGDATLSKPVGIDVADTPETITGKVDDIDPSPSDLPPSDTGEIPSN